jgi:GNAT superfamily N-acetyltransferase
MQASADDVRAVERLHVRAWPALETAVVHGWLWRYSGGGSQRANSVSTVQFCGEDLDAALDDVENRYRARGAAVRLHTYDLTLPSGLPGLLETRGYGRAETTVTMMKPTVARELAADIVVADSADGAWREVYLGAITESRRAVNARILDAIPRPNGWFLCRRGNEVISTGLCVVDGDLAVVECMATRPEARRQGGARAVLEGIEAWAFARGVRALALQVVAANPPAAALYRGLGFEPVATNRFWLKT